MSMPYENNLMEEKLVLSKWKLIFKLAIFSAFVSIFLVPIGIVSFFIWPQFPENIFAVIQESKFNGLMSLDFLFLCGKVLVIPLFLSMYLTLKKTNESLAIISLILGFISIITLIQSRPIFELLNLVDQYKLATTDIEKTEIVSAFKALLALFNGTASNISYLCGNCSLLIYSIMMIKSNIYSKSTAYVGLVANTLAFTYYIPQIGAYISIISFAGYLIWLSMIGATYLKLNKKP